MTLIANRYQQIAVLGKGGMGVVYRVRDTLGQQREFALKMIQVPGAITESLMLQFKDEFRVMNKLKHPNTVEVFDFGSVNDCTLYLTMEEVSGRDLSELPMGPAMPLGQIYDLLIQLLQALRFIHSRLFVHRDIKPQNIRVRDDGVLKLMDFGLMAQLGMPSDGKLTGTVAYLPPEVPRGGIVDASSDLYSLGCLAYELITGGAPFDGSVLEIVKAHIHQAPAELRAFRPDVPDGLQAIVSRLLAKEQAERYRSADEVIADLATLAGVRLARDKLDHKASYLSSSSLVGRKDEMRKLEAGLESLLAGEGRATFVAAPAGVGKSRLVHELLLQAKLDGAQVLRGQCLEGGQGPYDPLAQALRSLIPCSTDAEIKAHGPALLKLLPELAERGVVAPGGADKLGINEAVLAWLQATSARQPLVLFFDDLHWCDSASLQVLNHLIRHLETLPVYVLSTFRNDEVSDSSPVWFTVDEGLTACLRLEQFNLEQVLELVRAMLQRLEISEECSQFLFDSTGGNAYFVTEILRYLMEDGALVQRDGVWHFPANVAGLELPATVEDTILRRLRQIGPDALLLARVASVMGRYQQREMFLALSGLEEERFFAALDELIESQFLLKEEQRYTFPHDRVREALYKDLPAALRQQLHERCGTLIEERAANADAAAQELAFHFSRGQDQAKAYRYLQRAGDLAMAEGQQAVAMANWLRAEQVLETIAYPNKEVLLTRLWWTIGKNGVQGWQRQSRDALEKLVPALEGQGDAQQASVVLRHVYRKVLAVPRLREKYLARFTAPRVYRHDPARRGRPRPYLSPSWLHMLTTAYSFLGSNYGPTGEPEAGLALLEKARKLMPFAGSPLDGALAATFAVCLNPAGRYDEMLARCHYARPILPEVSLKTNPDFAAAWGAANGLILNVSYQGLEPRREDLDYLIERCDRYRIPALKNFYWGRYAIWTLWTGRHDETQEFVELIMQNSRRIGGPPYQWALYLRAHLHWQRGQFEEALGVIQQALRFDHVVNDLHVYWTLIVLRGHAQLDLGEQELANADFEAAIAFGRGHGLYLILIQGLIGRGEGALRAGDDDAAEASLAEAHSLSAGGPARNPLHQAITERLLAEIASARGAHGGAIDHVETALRLVSAPEADNILEQAKAWQTRGMIEEAAGQLEAARESLLQAVELFHRLGNRHHVRVARATLGELRSRVEAGPPTALSRRSRALATSWSKSIREWASGAIEEEEALQSMLNVCLECFDADAASLFLRNGEWTWRASRTPMGPAACPRINQAYLSQAAQTREPLCALDLPENLEFTEESVLDDQIPSVLVAPLRVLDDREAILYLSKCDLSEPFDEQDLGTVRGLERELNARL